MKNQTREHDALNGEVSRMFSLAELLEEPSVYECVLKAKSSEGGVLLDGGVEARGGFRAALIALDALYDGRGYADYGRIETMAGYVPTVDSFLDDAAVAASSFLHEDSRGVRGGSEKLGVRLVAPGFDYTHDFNAARSEIVIAAGSFLHHIFRAAGALIRAVCALLDGGFPKASILWAWGKAPLVMRRQDESGLVRYQDKALQAAAVSAVWVRSEDEALESFCRSWQGQGELRLHNVSTGNTFIGGRFDAEQLWDIYTGNAD